MLQKNLNASLHGLRGFAALSVLIYHLWAGAIDDNFIPEHIPTIVGNFFLSLNAGVELFFLISGYLITGSLIKNSNVNTFIRNRFIRIYPPFLPLVLIIFILGPFAGYDYFNEVGLLEWFLLLAANLLFLPGIFPIDAALLVAWTLSYEAAFYIFSALMFIIYQYSQSKLSRKFITIFIIITSLVCCYFYPQALFFGIGTIIYFGKEKIEKVYKAVWTLSPIYLILFLIGTFFLNHMYDQLSEYNSLTLVMVSTLTYILVSALFASVVLGEGAVAKVMNLAIFQFLGTISYSLYLWHTPIMFVTKKVSIKLFEASGPDVTFWAFTLSSIIISIPVAYVSFLIFEDYIPKKLKKNV